MADFATIEDVDLSQAEAIGNRLLTQVDRLREDCPLYWSEMQQEWIVSGHAEVTEGFSGRLPLSAGRHKLLTRYIPDPSVLYDTMPYAMQLLPNWLTNTDPPHQLRLRKLMMKAFSRKVAEANRPFAQQLIAGLLDNVEERGEVEFMEDVARQVPANIILRMMDLPQEVLPRLKRWAYYMNAGLGGAFPTMETLKITEACLIEMTEIFLGELRRKENSDGEGFMEQLIQARDGDDRLTEDEMVAICHLTLIAGHDTTANSLALGTALLADDASARDYIRDHPDQITNITMEIMRLSAVSTSMKRIATEDFEWRGNRIKEGDVVVLMIIGANRDPRVFDDPLRLDFTRNQMENMTFAPGLHHCIGHHMAKMQLGEFFPELLRRFESFEVLEPEIRFGGGISFRGPEELRMRFHASRAA